MLVLAAEEVASGLELLISHGRFSLIVRRWRHAKRARLDVLLVRRGARAAEAHLIYLRTILDSFLLFGDVRCILLMLTRSNRADR